MTITLNEADLASIQVSTVVDARGAACPGPLLEAKKAIGKVGVGAVLELWSSDGQTKKDVEAWANKVGQAFLGAAPAAGYERVFVRRAK
jgi:TusA-related sulfurtransferase